MNENINDFLLQALETELGGVQIYTAALACAQNKDLKQEWEKYLEETREHVNIYTDLLSELDVNPEDESPGREIAKHKAKGLVKAMQMAGEAGDKQAAELVAAESVVEAEAKCHLNWELVGQLAKHLKGDAGKELGAAYKEVEDEEDEHLYHSAGWARELWIKRLGMPAVLPPPEEEKNVKTAIGAARAKQTRKELL